MEHYLLRAKVLFLLFFCSLIFSNPKHFNDKIKNAIHEALVRFESRKSQIYQLANQYNVDPKLLSSIVFPELIRYSHLKDKVEISALYSLYVLFGKEFSNYSVGMFQMKPSFIEKLETEIVKYPDI